MKSLIFICIVLINLSLISLTAGAQEGPLKKDFSTLGEGQSPALKKAPRNVYQVVQPRLVNRNMRFELGINYGLVGGGDAYFYTQNIGTNVDFHISPIFSAGLRYYHSLNRLTSAGQSAFDSAERRQADGLPFKTPAIDYPTDTALVVANWYPTYGKLNLFDLGISHFDVYLQGGYGKVNLSSGISDVFAAGLGLGFWFTSNMTIRLEGRWQTYQDHPYFDDPSSLTRRLDTIVGMASIGSLL